MCTVHSQPVKGMAYVPLAPCDPAFTASPSALCHYSLLLAFLTSDGVKPTDLTRKMNLICLILMD